MATSMNDRSVDWGHAHVAFRISRRAARTELKVTGGLVAVLILAIGICGSILPARSGWLPMPSPIGASSGRVDLSDRLPSQARFAAEQG